MRLRERLLLSAGTHALTMACNAHGTMGAVREFMRARESGETKYEATLCVLLEQPTSLRLLPMRLHCKPGTSPSTCHSTTTSGCHPAPPPVTSHLHGWECNAFPQTHQRSDQQQERQPVRCQRCHHREQRPGDHTCKAAHVGKHCASSSIVRHVVGMHTASAGLLERIIGRLNTCML